VFDSQPIWLTTLLVITIRNHRLLQVSWVEV